MPPTIIIDADLDPFDHNNYFAIEEESIWRTQNLLTVGVATWTEVYTSAEFTLGTDMELLRIRCAPGTEDRVYALCVATIDSVATACCLVSYNGGDSWTAYEIGEASDPDNAFTLGDVEQTTEPSDSIETYFSGGGNIVTMLEVGEGGEGYDYPSTYMYVNIHFDPPLPTGSHNVHYTDTGSCLSEYNTTNGDQHCMVRNNYAGNMGSVVKTAISGGWDVTGVISTYETEPDLLVGWPYGWPGRWLEEVAFSRAHNFTLISIDSITFGDAPSRAFDVARSNGDWVYAGIEGKIMKSTDGGQTWTALHEDMGATDICVDPQAAGVIYYWSTDGDLYYTIDTERQDSLLTGSITSNDPLRIARSLNSGKLWVIDGDTLKMRDLGAWTTQIASGVTSGQGLRAFVGDKLAYVTPSDIQYSADAGVTWASKKGSWSVAWGKVIHLTS